MHHLHLHRLHGLRLIFRLRRRILTLLPLRYHHRNHLLHGRHAISLNWTLALSGDIFAWAPPLNRDLNFKDLFADALARALCIREAFCVANELLVGLFVQILDLAVQCFDALVKVFRVDLVDLICRDLVDEFAEHPASFDQGTEAEAEVLNVLVNRTVVMRASFHFKALYYTFLNRVRLHSLLNLLLMVLVHFDNFLDHTFPILFKIDIEILLDQKATGSFHPAIISIVLFNLFG